ncbi:unnamed protein product (macronuclear) [Paramecium tetraurelia]|uniref:Uncharacterized protein n=1 Tax=Paramecium tetraurelia TaxID=5888 RepID=A0CM53_PARTE|nr:uncharacterized protein GSPATT00008349001 [Paramecium tetraurelia]CAK71870.1 unnamed protein product [Paramecium tetraurelia]|eukprot:XP_001439267.1 hypothetical protein (macronuclear) [Paramecium tetraurelia strain d4-2]
MIKNMSEIQRSRNYFDFEQLDCNRYFQNYKESESSLKDHINSHQILFLLAKNPAVGNHLKNIFFIICDAYGILSPVSILNPEQDIILQYFNFESTEKGVKVPVATFLACLKMLSYHSIQLMEPNVGYSILAGQMENLGKRIALKNTRLINDAIHIGEFDNFELFKQRFQGRLLELLIRFLIQNILGQTYLNMIEYQEIQDSK